jgi:phosphatidylethanolamine-binding protein (PEBP) family uncharacterized protein
MGSITARTILRIASATAGLAILAVLTGSAGGGDAQGQPPTMTISADFPDGGNMPWRYACKTLGGDEIPPPLAWSAPPDSPLALVMQDLDAGPFVHWIVFGMSPGPGSSAAGQTPGNGSVLPNGNGDATYRGPCPPAGTGTHRYVFTLYQTPANLDVPGGGSQAAQAIAQASTAQAQWTGTFTAGAPVTLGPGGFQTSPKG